MLPSVSPCTMYMWTLIALFRSRIARKIKVANFLLRGINFYCGHCTESEKVNLLAREMFKRSVILKFYLNPTKTRVAEPPDFWAAPAPDQNFGGSGSGPAPAPATYYLVNKFKVK